MFYYVLIFATYLGVASNYAEINTDERRIIFLLGLALLTLVCAIYYRMANGHPNAKSAEQLKYSRQFLNRARNVKEFPPPFPNTWYFAMHSEDLKNGQIVPLQLVGREMVCFRNWEGKVSIQNAFCPHLGAHLGQAGSKVDRNGNIVCPFHNWKFDVEGKCQDIPYCTKDISMYSGIHNFNYPVCEKWGMIFFWYHCDNEPPRFNVEMHEIFPPCYPIKHRVRRGNTTVFDMHMMEPSLNTQDWFHFTVVHQNYPHFKPLKTFHQVRDVDFRDDGHFSFFEDMQTQWQIPFLGTPLTPKIAVPHLHNKIRFCGPAIAVIVSQFGKMTNTCVFTFTPIEPFKTKVDFTTFSSDGAFGLWPLASTLVGFTAEWTVKQDMEIWGHKSNPNPRKLVSGDGAGFNQYRKWLEQFYTEGSKKSVTLDW